MRELVRSGIEHIMQQGQCRSVIEEFRQYLGSQGPNGENLVAKLEGEHKIYKAVHNTIMVVRLVPVTLKALDKSKRSSQVRASVERSLHQKRPSASKQEQSLRAKNTPAPDSGKVTKRSRSRESPSPPLESDYRQVRREGRQERDHLREQAKIRGGDK